MNQQFKHTRLALAVTLASFSSFTFAEMPMQNPNETVQSETVVNAEEAPSETVENATEVPVESSSDPLSVQFTEAQAASLDFSTFNAFKQSLSAVLQDGLPEDIFVSVSQSLQLPSEEAETETDEMTSSETVPDVNELFDGFFAAQESEGFSALSYKKEILLNLGSAYGFEVSFFAKATETIADETSVPGTEESGLGNGGIIAALVGVGVAAGGGGSSSSSDNGTYRNTIEGAFATEYTANVGLANHNILALNDYGYTGNGIKVGVVDTGIDATHQEFEGKTIYGTDFASSPTDYNRDENGHGTHVASIIAGNRDQFGMRGMAYDAILYSYKVDNDGDIELEGLSSDTAIAAIFNQHVIDGIQVSNNSWGGSTPITDPSLTETGVRATRSLTIAAARSFQTNGGVIVFSAGNSSSAQPDSRGGLPYLIAELANEWLVVVAVDANGKEPAYTNRCGVAKAFCVTALGGGDTQATEGVYAADAGTTNGYTRLSGTSMAAPHVSGLVAALMEKFPSLTAAQIVTRVKNGASLTGLTGFFGETTSNRSTAVMEEIFGHGLVNAAASSSVMGAIVYPTGSSLSDGSVSTVSLPIGLSPRTINQIMNSEFVAFDSFDGARFYVRGAEIFRAQSSSVMPRFGVAPEYTSSSSVALTFAEQSDSHLYAISTGSASVINGSSSFWGSKANLFNNGLSPSDVDVSQVEWKLGDNQVAIHPFVKTSGDGSVFGSGLNVRYSPSETASSFIGFSSEQTALGLGTTETARAAASTRSFEAGFNLLMSEQWAAFGRIAVDSYAGIDATQSSLGLSGVESTGVAGGLHWRDSLTDIAFGFYRPSTLSDGALVMVAPVGRTQTDEIVWGGKMFDIDSANSSYPLFFAFNKRFGGGAAIGFSVKESELYQRKLGGAELSFSFEF